LAAAATQKGERLKAIVDAIGGVRLLAMECSVSSTTVRTWLTGTRTPSPANRRRIGMLARDFGLPTPYEEWGSGTRRRTP
jgi:hypothetical protein